MGQKFTITESDRNQIRGLYEQQTDFKQNYLSKGYIDVTDGFNKDTYVLQIPDGEYKCDGFGYSFKIVTNDGKDTGYVVVMENGVRGAITGRIIVSENGIKVSFEQWISKSFQSLLYNEKLNQIKVKK
jgi:hypothetical protein